MDLRNLATPNQPGLPDAVRTGFEEEPPTIPPRFFYDRRGSKLFERICELPEYYLTEAEDELLTSHGRAILERAGGPRTVLELGAGNAEKTERLLRVLMNRHERPEYWMNDVDETMLRATGERLAERFPDLVLTGLAGTYEAALGQLEDSPAPRLVCFLGSSLGNYEPPQARKLLRTLAEPLDPADRVLLGLDRVKEKQILKAAYDDSRGITAAFNKNLLLRINRQLAASIDPATFRHRAPYLEDREQIQMHLVSQRGQWIRIPRLETRYRFPAGSYIHTETCQKYSLDSIRQLIEPVPLALVEHWTDGKERFFSILLKPT